MKIRMIILPLAIIFAKSLSADCSAQEFALSTNVLDYVNFGTMNIQAAYGFDKHWSLNAGMKYNPFSFNSGEKESRNKQISYSVGARFWPWHIYSGWWLSGGVRYQEYNSGGITSVQTSEGDRFGGSLGAGYTHMLNNHLNLEFGVGIWGGYDIFTTYECQTCGKIISDGRKYFVRPSDIMVALTYIF